MKTRITLDFYDYQKDNSKVFVGKDFGKEVKELTHINDLINMFDLVSIKIPDNIKQINPSFLEEFLHDVVLQLGKDEFYQKIKFTCFGMYLPQMKVDIYEAVDRIKRTIYNKISNYKITNKYGRAVNY